MGLIGDAAYHAGRMAGEATREVRPERDCWDRGLALCALTGTPGVDTARCTDDLWLRLR